MIDGEDTFKIVAVLKRRGNSSTVEYSYVPHNWEQNETLYWPQNNLTSLRADPSTTPLEDWKTYKCKVKKKNICGIEEAELWEGEYVSCGTDVEDSVSIGKKSTNRNYKPNKDVNNSAIDDQFDILSINEPAVVVYTEPSQVKPSSEEIIIENYNIDCNLDCNQCCGQNTIFLKDLKQKLSEVTENQKKMFSELTHQKLINDKMYLLLKGLQISIKNTDQTALNSEESNEGMNHFISFPLQTVEEVMSFNKLLETNEGYKKYMIKTYNSIGGVDGNEDGKQVAKKIRSVVFTEHVLTLFSWTGVSRTPGLEKKDTFQLCEGILDFFLTIIQLADSRWNATKNEKFFKYNSLKHAKQMEKAQEKKKKSGLKEKAINDDIIVPVLEIVFPEGENNEVPEEVAITVEEVPA